MVSPEQKPEQDAKGKRRREEQTRFRYPDKAHQEQARSDYEAGAMIRNQSAAIGTERLNRWWNGIILGGSVSPSQPRIERLSHYSRAYTEPDVPSSGRRGTHASW